MKISRLVVGLFLLGVSSVSLAQSAPLTHQPCQGRPVPHQFTFNSADTAELPDENIHLPESVFIRSFDSQAG